MLGDLDRDVGLAAHGSHDPGAESHQCVSSYPWVVISHRDSPSLCNEPERAAETRIPSLIDNTGGSDAGEQKIQRDHDRLALGWQIRDDRSQFLHVYARKLRSDENVRIVFHDAVRSFSIECS
jgi:hypothetical protein